MVDVTARTLAEEALRASEARLMEAQRIASTGSWELDLSTRTAIWSEETYRIYGRPPSADRVDSALAAMVEGVRTGSFGGFLALDPAGEPLSFC